MRGAYKGKRLIIIVYLIAMIILVAWLLFGTAIIEGIVNNHRFNKINFENYSDELQNDPVYGSVYGGTVLDFIKYDSDQYETLMVNGWAMVETEQKNANREVALILRNDINCYMVWLSVTIRDDVPAELPISIGREMDIPSKYVGYSDEFSTLMMKDGTYELYLYCKENDINSGMADTGYRITKNGESIEVGRWQSDAMSDPVAENQTIRTNGGLTMASIDSDGYVSLQGWEYADAMGDQPIENAYVEIDNTSGFLQYTATTVRGLANRTERKEYVNYGWRAVIPAEELEDGEHTVRIYTVCGDSIWRSEDYKVFRDGDNMKILWESGQVENISISMDPNEQVYGSLDGVSLNEFGYLNLYGWAFLQNEKSENETVYFEITDPQGEIKTYVTARTVRNDVAKAYDNDDYKKSGWNAVVPAEDADGLYTMRLIIESNEKTAVSKTFAFQKEGGQFTKKWVSQGVNSGLNYAEEDGAVTKLDSMSITADNLLNLWGWAYVEGLDCGSQETFIEITSMDSAKVFTTMHTTRNDVAAAFDNDKYIRSGWNAVIPANELTDGYFTLRILVKQGEKIWRSNLHAFEKNANELTEKWVSQEERINTEIPEGDLVTSVDSVSKGNGDVLNIWGWTFAEGKNCDTQSVYLYFENPAVGAKVFTTQKQVRNDVSEHFSDPNYSRSGWIAVIPAWEIDSGNYDLFVIVENGEDIMKSGPYRIQVTESNVLIMSDDDR